MSTQNLWSLALELEVAIEDLYRSLTKRFEYDRAAAQTFSLLTRQKKSHVDLIRNQRRMETRKGGPQLSVPAEASQITSLLERAQEVQRAAGNLDLLGAIELGRSLERAADTLYGSVEGHQDPIQMSVIAKLQRDNTRDCGALDGLRAKVLGMAS
jgi:hypothetical protein